jgi:hypothetical protein
MHHRLFRVKPTGDGHFVAWEPGGSRRSLHATVDEAIATIEAETIGHGRAHVVVQDAVGHIEHELIVGPEGTTRISAA